MVNFLRSIEKAVLNCPFDAASTPGLIRASAGRLVLPHSPACNLEARRIAASPFLLSPLSKPHGHTARLLQTLGVNAFGEVACMMTPPVTRPPACTIGAATRSTCTNKWTSSFCGPAFAMGNRWTLVKLSCYVCATSCCHLLPNLTVDMHQIRRRGSTLLLDPRTDL